MDFFRTIFQDRLMSNMSHDMNDPVQDIRIF